MVLVKDKREFYSQFGLQPKVVMIVEFLQAHFLGNSCIAELHFSSDQTEKRDFFVRVGDNSL